MSRKAPPSLKPGPTDLQPPPSLESAPEGVAPAMPPLGALIGMLEAAGWVLEEKTAAMLIFRLAAPKPESPRAAPETPIAGPTIAEQLPTPPKTPPRVFVGAEGIPERDFAPMPPDDEAAPDEPQEAPKAPPRPASAPTRPPQPPPAAESGDICTSDRWPGTTGDGVCYWLGPEGCRIADTDRPLRCVTARVGGSPLGPSELEIAETRETQWEAANAVPVPRTLFDGNAAALDLMPDDIYRASMACLDGGPRKTSTKPPRAPALPPGIVVGEMDAQGNPIPEEVPDEVSRQVFDAAAKRVDKEIMAMGNEPAEPSLEEVTKDHTCEGIAADEPPTLEERIARDGIFEALQQSEPPRATEPRDVVLDFETPIETQPLRNGRSHVYVKRDDLFAVAGVRGGKARTCWAMATAVKAEGLITAGSRSSPQCNIVAHIARRLGIPCRLHIPQAKKPLEGELAEAQALGAEIVEHQYGRNSVIVARAREDFERQVGNWALIPFGMECREAVEQTRRQAQILGRYGRMCERIVVPVGSGMSLAGILWALGDIGAQAAPPVLGICVGADPRRRLDTWAPRGWRQTVTLKDASGGRDAYQRPAAETRLGDLELDPVYEAKCLPFLRPRDLLWVVGIRNTVAGHRS